jgi:hypothetical protein
VSLVLRLSVGAGVPFLVGRDEAMGVLVRSWDQNTEGLGQAVLGLRQELCARRGAGRRGWEAPEGAFPRKRLVECLSVSGIRSAQKPKSSLTFSARMIAHSFLSSCFSSSFEESR